MSIADFDDLDMQGIDPVWYSMIVRRSWQDEVMRLDPALRVLWDPRLSEIVVVFKNPSMLTDFANGKLVGWALTARFPIDMDIEGIVANLAGMADRNKYPSAEALIEDFDRRAAEEEKKRREAIKERDGEMFEEIDRNCLTTGTIAKDEAKKDERILDQTKRSTAHYKLIVPARFAPARVGGSA